MQSSVFLGEFLGTLMVILLGTGVVANVLLTHSKGNQGGWIVITAGWAFAVMIGVFVSQKMGSPGAHLNPIVTLAFAIIDQDWANVGTFWLAQFLGAFSGAVLCWLAYLPHWKATGDAGAKGGVFFTTPAINHPVGNILAETIGTFVLIVGVASLYDVDGSGLKPYLVGMLVWGIGLSLGGPTGYAINPFRDLGPRLAHQLLPIPGKGSSHWNYAWVPVVGPILGSLLAAAILA